MLMMMVLLLLVIMEMAMAVGDGDGDIGVLMRMTKLATMMLLLLLSLQFYRSCRYFNKNDEFSHCSSLVKFVLPIPPPFGVARLDFVHVDITCV